MGWFKHANVYLFSISCCIIISLLVYTLYLTSANAELVLLINNQKNTISVLTAERDSLIVATEKQNESINKLKLDAEYYQAQIEQINTEIEQENLSSITLEFIGGGTNVSEKEAIEWLKSKRSYISF